MASKADVERELAAMQRLHLGEVAGADAQDIPDTPTPADLFDMLAKHGLSRADLEALLAQVGHDLRDLPKQHPTLALAGAFGLGFMLGRMSK